MNNGFISSIEEIIEDQKLGKMVIMVDDENRENEGDLIIPASKVDDKAINFMATHGRGLICLSLTEERVRQLDLPLMSQNNDTRDSTAFTISIEAKEGVTTGISAQDRAVTIQTAIDQKKGGWDKGNKKKAQTHYKVRGKIGSQYSWLELRPVTGRTHQLRIHCSDLGHPIIGDRKYKSREEKNSQDLPHSLKKLFLHAQSISFVHPISKKITKIQAELPKHMDTVWKHFGWEV